MNNTVTSQLTGAFNVNTLLHVWVDFAPFILAAVGFLIGVSLVKWGIHRVSTAMAGSDYWGGSISSTISNYRHRNDISPDEDFWDLSDAYSQTGDKRYLREIKRRGDSF